MKRVLLLLALLSALTAVVITLGWWSVEEPADVAPPPAEAPGMADTATPAPVEPSLSEQALDVAEPERVAVEPEPEPKPSTSPAEHVVRGRTVDPGGAPVPNVEVCLTDVGPTGLRTVRDVLTVSDANGWYELTDHQRSTLTARKDGWLHLTSEPRPDAPRVAERLVLAPAAKLRVTLRHPSGEPVEGRHGEVILARSERHAPKGFVLDRPRLEQAYSGADGVLDFPAVWARQRLVLSLPPNLTIDSVVRRGATAEGVLDPATPDQVPLVLQPGEELELDVTLAETVVVSGIVLNADRKPTRASVLLSTLDDVPHDSPRRASVSTTSDSDGTFQVWLTPRLPVDALVLRASSQLRGWVGGGGDRELASLPIDPATSPIENVELVLQPTSNIAGVVRSGDGEPLKAALRIARHGDESRPSTLENGARTLVSTFGKGHFRFSGLEPGSYDIVATANGRETQSVQKVEAGAGLVEIVFPTSPKVRVTIDAEADVELDKIVVLRGSLLAYEEPTLDALRSGLYDGLDGWPENLTGLWSGVSMGLHELGPTSLFLSEVESLPFEVELEPGFGWIGMKATVAGGGQTFPIGTGLVELVPGEYTLTFRQEPRSVVRGRALGVPPERRLFAAISTLDGALARVHVARNRYERLAELGGSGTFDFAFVPPGEYELWLGSEEELLAGTPQHSTPFTAEDGAPVELEIDLGG